MNTSYLVRIVLHVCCFAFRLAPYVSDIECHMQSCVTEGYLYDGAIMITASHLPSHRNGFKFFSKSGGLNNQDIAEVNAVV